MVRFRKMLGLGEEPGLVFDDVPPGVPGGCGWVPDVACTCCAVAAAMILDATVGRDGMLGRAAAKFSPGDKAEATAEAGCMLVAMCKDDEAGWECSADVVDVVIMEVCRPDKTVLVDNEMTEKN